MRYFGWSLLLGVFFFVGREWYLQAPGSYRIITGPDFVNIQIGKTNYLVGEAKAFDRLQPRGYFLRSQQMVLVSDLDIGQQIGYVTRWSEDFAVFQMGKERIFWFGTDFDPTVVQRLPVKLESDIWLLSASVSLEGISLPQEFIIWYGAGRIPKKIQERATESEMNLLNPYKSGLKRLQLRAGKWKMR